MLVQRSAFEYDSPKEKSHVLLSALSVYSKHNSFKQLFFFFARPLQELPSLTFTLAPVPNLPPIHSLHGSQRVRNISKCIRYNHISSDI